MAYPCISEVPPLALILVMCAFYAIRKQSFIATAYRRFVFFLMYFMQFSLTIKLVVRIITSIQFVKSNSEELKKTNGVIFVKTFWGDFNPHEKSEKKQWIDNFVEISSIILCIFMIQCWKTCKWFEIRYKTMHMDENTSTFSRTEAYFDLRQ